MEVDQSPSVIQADASEGEREENVQANAGYVSQSDEPARE